MLFFSVCLKRVCPGNVVIESWKRATKRLTEEQSGKEEAG